MARVVVLVVVVWETRRSSPATEQQLIMPLSPPFRHHSRTPIIIMFDSRWLGFEDARQFTAQWSLSHKFEVLCVSRKSAAQPDQSHGWNTLHTGDDFAAFWGGLEPGSWAALHTSVIVLLQSPGFQRNRAKRSGMTMIWDAVPPLELRFACACTWLPPRPYQGSRN
ncbi:hypothetical protein CIRG_05575 [Coccidioides immitis RMSCC 2394]|uniref:Uncharacterized protein n=1 Tax=Coccidioides immitis RMSCC 2394 TaxID=404692 RepID=A0A0J6YFZ9_COCIT|nr:hypothetical protein CIRG_05575 [Coccidioides immitis RMSCC 2394]